MPFPCIHMVLVPGNILWRLKSRSSEVPKINFKGKHSGQVVYSALTSVYVGSNLSILAPFILNHKCAVLYSPLNILTAAILPVQCSVKRYTMFKLSQFSGELKPTKSFGAWIEWKALQKHISHKS